MLCMLILYIVEGPTVLKAIPNDRIFGKLLMQFYLLSEFLPEICWEVFAEKYFFEIYADVCK